jgi:predicted enzyme involved in methoxymalonyl-ACP biosynthesis
VMVLRPTATGADELEIDTWVMSCRVFGRQLEDEAMNIAAEHARSRGAKAIVARLVPTDRNAVIHQLFPGLGFDPTDGPDAVTGSQWWRLDLAAYKARPTHIRRARS